MRLDKLTYTKPYKILYIDMVIWVDNNYQRPDCDDTKLYEYLYHLLFMVASKQNYFKHVQQCDDYALQGASKLFIRLKDPRQFEDGQLSKIKSILNYIKKVSYPYKIDFENSYYIDTAEDSILIQSDNLNISNYIAEESDIFDLIEFETSLSDIPAIVKNYIDKLICPKDNVRRKNIYISCMLTLINIISVSEQDLKAFASDKTDISNYIDYLYRSHQAAEPILYHLPANLANYITVIVRELQHIIAKELSFKTYSLVSSENSIKSLLAANLEDEQWG